MEPQMDADKRRCLPMARLSEATTALIGVRLRPSVVEFIFPAAQA
jgi:hypothetical protein